MKTLIRIALLGIMIWSTPVLAAALTPSVNQLNPQQQGGLAFLNAARWVDSVVLAANTAQAYSLTTLKTNAALKQSNVFLIFSSDGPFWANFNNGTAAIPASSSQGSTDGAGSEFSPNQRYIDTVAGENQISFIAAATTHISVSVYVP